MTNKEQENTERIDYFSRDFWLNWRETSGFNTLLKRRDVFPHGRNKCFDWLERVHQQTEGTNFPLKSAKCTGKSWEFLRDEHGLIGGHVWLETETTEGRRYIADGTAGQVDPNYLEGFYGTFEEASPVLQRVYAERQIWKSVFENNCSSNK